MSSAATCPVSASTYLAGVTDSATVPTTVTSRAPASTVGGSSYVKYKRYDSTT